MVEYVDYFELLKKEWLPGHKEVFKYHYMHSTSRLRKVGRYLVFQTWNYRPAIVGVNEDGRLFLWVSPLGREVKTEKDIRQFMGYDDEVSEVVAILRPDGKRYRVQGDVTVWAQPHPLAFVKSLAMTRVVELFTTALANSLVDFLASKGVTAQARVMGGCFHVEVDTKGAREVFECFKTLVDEWKEGVSLVGAEVDAFTILSGTILTAEVKVVRVPHEEKIAQEIANVFKNEEATWSMKIGRHRVRCVNCAPRAVTYTFKSPELDLLNGLDGEEYSVTVTLPPRTVYVKKGSRLIFEHPEHRKKTLVFEEEASVEVGTIFPSAVQDEVNHYALRQRHKP